MDYTAFIRPEYVLMLIFAGALITYFAGKYSSMARYSLSLLFSGLALLMVALLYGKNTLSVWTPSITPNGISMYVGTNPLTWFFAIILASLSFLTIMYSIPIMKGKRMENWFHTLTLLLMGSMLGVVFSSDLLSFFIFWEMMTLSSYLLVTLAGKRSDKAALNYMILSTMGAYSMLTGITMLYVHFGTTEFSLLSAQIPGTPVNFLWLSLGLVAVGFLVKSAALPFYVWAAPAYSEAPDGFTPLFSGALSKLGAYGLFLFMYVIVGMSALIGMGSFRGVSSFGYAIALLGGITAFIATLYAIREDDIKRLLAYSSVSQVGYILMGLGIGTSLSVAGSLYHALNHALFKTVLFMGAGAIIQLTGTRKMSEMGGLATRMPITFLTMLISIFSLAAIPMTSGFGSKWLIYEAAINKGFVFIAPLAFVASVGSFLYSFRLLQAVFLGQLPDGLKDAKDPSLLVTIPMIALTSITVLFAIVPGVPLGAIASAESYMGIQPIQVDSLFYFRIGNSFGAYNALVVMTILLFAMLVAMIMFAFAGSKSKKVDQHDTYLSGEIYEHHSDLGLHYAANFYRPIERMFEPYLRLRLERTYDAFGRGYELLSEGIRRVYSGDVQTYVYYVIGFLGMLIILAGWWW